MLGNEVLLFGMLGLFTSAFISYFISGIKEQKTIIICSLQGAFTGWLSGMMWVYLTGGLEVTLFALVLPVLISGFFTFLLLHRLPQATGQSVGKGTSAVAAIAFFVIIFFIAFSSVPIAYRPMANTDTFSVATLDYQPEMSTITKADAGPTNLIPISIKCTKSNVETFGVMSENAAPSSSLDFKIFLSPGADWPTPYITISVYSDKDNNGMVSKGDVLWSDANYKVATTNSQWRTNCLYENGVAKYNMISHNGKPLPIFHANTITKVKDETNIKFLNTPDGYSPQNDMLTWEDGVLKEQVVDYAGIMAGDSASIQGTIYCGPDATANNLIVVKAYCGDCATDPFGDNQPITEQAIPFTVSASAAGADILGFPPTVILIGLGVLLGIGLLYAKKEGML